MDKHDKATAVEDQFEEHQQTISKNSHLVPLIKEAAELISNAIKKGNKVLICGNGGSAADAQHIAAELVGYYETKSKGLPAIALTTDTSFLTAWGNDDAFENIFSRQVEAVGKPGDVLIGISTSGNSENVIQAIKTAREQKLSVITFLGKSGGTMKDLGDVELFVESNRTARIQETHQLCYHIMCGLVEEDCY